METLRRASAAVLAAVIALTSVPVRAVSLYDGVKTRPAPAAPVVPALPTAVIPQIAPLGQAIPAIPGVDAAIPQAPQAPALQDPSSQLPAPLASLEAPAIPAAPTAMSSLEAADAKLEAPGADQSAALETAFDAGIAAHVGAAISEYFGALPAGQEPGVVVSKKKQSGAEGAPTDSEMENNVKASPKTNPEREQIAIRMFQRGGAKYDPATAKVARPDFNRDGEVQVQDVPGWGGEVAHNIFVVKKGHPKAGEKERVIVVTSHNDKVDVGDGVIDNWTGTTMVAHLYQSIKDRDTSATYIFAAFAREEEGLVGSKQFLRSMTPDQRALIELNTNVDTIAIKGGGTNSWENNSDEEWLDMVDAAVAQANKALPAQNKIDLARQQLNGGDADSSTFRNQRPPIIAGTIFSGPEDLIFSIIHSVNDNIGAFDFALYKNTYRVLMATLDWLDSHRVTRRAIVGVS